MWSILANDVMNIGRSPGGERFTALVDTLIRTQAFVLGLPNSCIDTNLRTNIADGGVDTKVGMPAPKDSTGWLGITTIWQYKATNYSNVSSPDLKEEVNKDYAKKCIAQNYAYRFCICDSMPSEKKNEWETELTQYVREINPDASEAKVLTADDIAAWINRFPAIILRFFKPNLGKALHSEAWKPNITRLTPVFVPAPGWESMQQAVKTHVDLSVNPADTVLTIQGEAGVGKTRMAFEALMGIEGAPNLVVYTNDEQNAKEIAIGLANDSSLMGILVADECMLPTRTKLESLLSGHHKSVRVIAIDNTGERPASGAPEYWLKKFPRDVLEKVLEENFPYVSRERRRAYAELSDGFVRLAADMCAHDPEIAAAGHVGPIAGNIRDYLRNRLSPEELKVAEAIALVSRVGFKDEVAEESNLLCKLTNLDKEHLLEKAHRLHDAPGFVNLAGRFLYVTPEIIAQVAFEGAWRRWGENNPESFLKQIPDQLLEVFLKRVARSATEEVRRQIGGFFRRWALGLEPTELASVKTMGRLEVLVDTDPDTYLPILRNLVERCTHEQLLAINGNSFGGRGSRRKIVWLAERMAAFPEYFGEAERVLLLLATAESEPNIGNNATGIWTTLFRLPLSGTATPFWDRLNSLREKILSNNKAISDLGLKALDVAFSEHASRMLGPAVVAGRITPADWYPKTWDELRQCKDASVALLRELVENERQDISEESTKIAIKHMRPLLRAGYLEELKGIFSVKPILAEVRAEIIDRISELIYFDHRTESEKDRLPQDYIDKVQKWLGELQPIDLHERIVVSVGIDSWHSRLYESEEEWKQEIRSLAIQLCQDRQAFEKELEWLCSVQAKSAPIIGEEVGKLDAQGAFLEIVINCSVRHESTEFSRGYLIGLLKATPESAERLNKLLDDVEDSNPGLAYNLYIVGGQLTQSLQRTLRLIDANRLPATYLQGFAWGIGGKSLSLNDFAEVLDRLAKTIENKNKDACRVALHLVSFRLHREKEESLEAILNHKGIREQIWHIMEMATEAHVESYEWGEILEALAALEPENAARIAANALIGEGLDYNEKSIEVLSNMAKQHPNLVMGNIGRVMLDEEKGWRFYVGKYKGLFHSMPTGVVTEWIRTNGVEAARRIARNLPEPYLENGNPVVPPLTEFVLKHFEDDDRVFREFCAGVHSLKIYSGDIAAKHEQEAEMARRFLNHPLRRIREWADYEIEDGQREAAMWRQQEEEMDLG